MEQTEERPKWLTELENRKLKKPHLAHEVGAGAPCMICDVACPGLDLHFWRKICKNCKCNRDDHDVDDNEFPQFELLFGPSSKSRKKPTFLRLKYQKQNEAETAFEWVPPNTTKELATDYMKALPKEKLPVKGSTGAVLRKQQLQRQIPLHDIDYKACDELSEQELADFKNYLENLKNNAGQGIVTKICAPRPFNSSLMTPANAADMQRLSPQHSPVCTNIPALHLRTPSSFTSNRFHPPSGASYNAQDPLPRIGLGETLNAIPSTVNSPLKNINTDIARSEQVAGIKHGTPTVFDTQPGRKPAESIVVASSTTSVLDPTESENLPERGPFYSTTFSHDANSSHNYPSKSLNLQESKDLQNPMHPLLQLENLSLEDALRAENVLSDALLPPSAMHAKDIVGSTLDEKSLQYIREKLTHKYNPQEKLAISSPVLLNEKLKNGALPASDVHNAGYSSAEKEKHVKPFNIENKNECLQETKEKINPSTNSGLLSTKLISSGPMASNIVHSESLENSIFPHEAINTRYQNPSSSNKGNESVEQSTNRIDSNLPKCHNCEGDIHVGDVVVTAAKAKNSVWHPGCFTCSICNELLADLVYFYHKNQLYCARDLAKHLGIPRCFACDELIFVREYTVAEGHNYHVKHFCCWDCDVPLAGQQYISENDRPLCLVCYQNTYAKTCNACKKIIAADQQGVVVKNLDFHANETCFSCYICQKNLLNGKIAVKNDKLFCSKDCISTFQTHQ